MKEICPVTFPFSTPCICPLRIIFMLSYPWNVFHAVSKEKKPNPGFTSRLMRPMVLFDQVVEVFHLSQFHMLRQYTSGFQVGNSLGIGRVFIDIDHTRCQYRG